MKKNTVFAAPVTTDKTLAIACLDIVVQNAGNCNILINECWTLKPDSTFGNNALSNTDSQEVNWTIRFLPDTNTSGGATVQRLEIAYIKTC